MRPPRVLPSAVAAFCASVAMAAAGAVDDKPADIVRSVVACWHPPHDGDEITVRVSFRRDGSLFGSRYVTYAKPVDGAARLATSVLRAIAGCTPLRFTPSLGAAIAGRIFLIRFVARRPSRAASI